MNNDLLRLATILNRIEALPPLNIAQPLRVKTSQKFPLSTHNDAPDTLFILSKPVLILHLRGRQEII